MGKRNKGQNVIDRILRNDESALYEIYDKFTNPFISFFQKYGLSITELEDTFQDTVIALYQNIMKGRVEVNEASLKTYIWSIGKYKVIDIIRMKNKNKKLEIHNDEVEPFEMRENILSKNQRLLYKHFKSLGESCQQIIKYFYYEGLTIEEIVQITDYKDANTVKSTKSRCIKQLKKLINQA